MNSKISKRLACFLASSALSFGLGSAPAFAQTAAQGAVASGGDVDAIVVTARRREETLKDVPVAVSAFSAARLDATGVRDITDLQKSAPSLSISPARGSNSTLVAFIRGVGQQDPLWGFEPGVGLYVDDVYIARPQAAVLDVFDVSRIEVLRGPQGTLYGRNTVGGAIKYVTNKIGGTPELDVKGQFGSYGEHDEIVSGKALITPTLGISGALAKYDHGGYGTNLNTGADTYNKNVLAARASIEWSPTNDLFFRLSGDNTTDRSNARNGHRETPYTNSAGVTYGVLPNVYDTQAGAGDINRVQAWGTSFLAQWTMNPNFTFKAITAYRRGRTEGNIDFDETPNAYLDVPAAYRDHQLSQEFQVLFNLDKLHGVAGFFYLNAQASGSFDTTLLNASPTTGYTVFDSGYVNTTSYAGYIDASYDLTEKFQVSLGGRYTSDEKTGHVLRQAYLGTRSPYFGNIAAVPLGPPNTNYTNSRTFNKFTPRVSVTYKIDPDLTTYASYSQGFKSGGFDMRGDAIAYPNTVKGYAPETVDAYEVGLKGNLWSHGTFALALFDSEYKNQQITTQYPSSSGGIASVVDNVGSSNLHGVEYETTVRLLPEISLRGSISRIWSKFNQYLAYIPGQGIVDVSNQRKLQNTPKWTGSIAATWSHSLGKNGKVELTPQASYRSFTQQFETPTPLIDQPAYWLYDVDLVWTSASGKYEAGFHAKNLSDERYKIGGYTFPGALYGNSVDAFYGPPRTFTFSVAAKFY